MTRDDVSAAIRKIIYDCVPDQVPEEIHDDTVVNHDMAIDSMGFILVICRCEAELGVKIPERQWDKMSTFGDVVDAFWKRIEKQQK